MPLTIPNLARIKGEDPYVYEALTRIVQAINGLTKNLGVDPVGVVAAPPRIAGITVSAADGIFDIAILDPSAVQRGINYFIESDTSPAFTRPTVYPLGPSRNARLNLGNLTLYWRGYSQYLNSPPSEPVTYGAPPAAVTGGGAAGPAPQPSQGSGTSSPTQGGSGFGVPDRTRLAE